MELEQLPEETMKKITDLRKAQMCYLVLKVRCNAMPIAYTNLDVGQLGHDMALKAKRDEVGEKMANLFKEIGEATVVKYLKNKDWCQAHLFTIAEQRAATLECLGEEWDLDKVAQFVEDHSY